MGNYKKSSVVFLEEKTEKQKNLYKHRTFAWAAWIIAGLGGWIGYKSQAKPGYITFKEGYSDFNTKHELFILMKDMYRKEPEGEIPLNFKS